MKPLISIFAAYCILFVTNVHAATVDTAVTYSVCMKKNIKAVVIKPDNYTSVKASPVVYLLHGYSGNYADWISKVPSVAAFADEEDAPVRVILAFFSHKGQ